MSWKDILKDLVKSRKDEGVISSSKLGSGKPVIEGCHTQFPGLSSDAQRKQLIIGLDFGTAFTKVVIGEDRIRYAVPWRSPINSVEDYLLPGKFHVDSDGMCSLDGNGQEKNELKMRLLTGATDMQTLAEVCAYCALVFRAARSFILTDHQKTYRSFQIDWLINAGLPTGNYHDNTLVDIYARVLNAAWWVSTQSEGVRLESCRSALKDQSLADRDGALHPDVISTFPEFVAQVTGYVRSPLRSRDLHMLIDVGAGTVDATVFNIHEHDDEDRFPIFAKVVAPMGTRFLVKNRLKGREQGEEGEFSHFAPIPNRTRTADLLGLSVSELDKIDLPIRNELIKVVNRMLTFTKNRRYPMSRAWENGIPIFLCGGGANCDFYSKAVWDESNHKDYRFIKKGLPKPENFKADAVGSQEFNRLSVAFGLSYDPFDIGEIIKMEDVEDAVDDERSTSLSRNQSSSLQSCSRCNGRGGLHRPCEFCGGSGFVHV